MHLLLCQCLLHTSGVPSLCSPQDMGHVGGRWIAASLIPAVIIAVLFFFDHNVSAQLAQQVRSRQSVHCKVSTGTMSTAQRAQEGLPVSAGGPVLPSPCPTPVRRT